MYVSNYARKIKWKGYIYTNIGTINKLSIKAWQEQTQGVD